MREGVDDLDRHGDRSPPEGFNHCRPLVIPIATLVAGHLPDQLSIQKERMQAFFVRILPGHLVPLRVVDAGIDGVPHDCRRIVKLSNGFAFHTVSL